MSSNHFQGSTWSKWDLHVHTPASFYHNYKGVEDAWETFIADLESLPPEFKVIGINDYIFLEGFERVMEYRRKGRLQNLDLILPVIEIRLDQFAGHEDLKRINYHVIFSDELSVELIQTQFLGAIELDFQYGVGRENKWQGVPTIPAMTEIGIAIKDFSPEGKIAAGPLQAAYHNLVFPHAQVKKVLAKPYFEGKHITAIGKNEWASIKWNDSSVLTKRSLISSVDFVFTNAPSVEKLIKTQERLFSDNVNRKLLDASDAHRFSSDNTKEQNIGKCFTWIKGERTFEALRQAAVEYDSRVSLSVNPPSEPVHKVRTVSLDFPETSKLSGQNFCYRGKHEFELSPFFTCIIGGRGSGKSTLLQLIASQLSQSTGNQSSILRQLQLPSDTSISSCVSVNNKEEVLLEYVAQNNIESLAGDPETLTRLINRLIEELDDERKLEQARDSVRSSIQEIRSAIELTRASYELRHQNIELRSRIGRLETLAKTLEDPEYVSAVEACEETRKKLTALEEGKSHLAGLIGDIETCLESDILSSNTEVNLYTSAKASLTDSVKSALDQASSVLKLEEGIMEIKILQDKLLSQRQLATKFLEQKGYSSENIKELADSTKELNASKSTLDKNEEKEKGLASKLSLFDFVSRPASEYQAAIERLLIIASEKFPVGTDVRPISMEYRFSYEDLLVELVEWVQAETAGDTTRKSTISDILEPFVMSAPVLHSEFLTSLNSAKTKTGASLVSFFENECNFEIFKLKRLELLEDVERFGRVILKYDNRTLDSVSFGQRCTAVLVLILSLGHKPILIDEPEAHLDSSLIANCLVNLVKSRKRDRQIIFATHNANFVVNGDAELVINLECSQDGITCSKAFTIEDIKNRGVLMALEGGRDAFLRRENRYHIHQPYVLEA